MSTDLPTRFAPLRLRFSAVAVILIVIVGLPILVWQKGVSMLQSAADRWAVSDALVAADAVVVLGGGSSRPYAAAELYRRGMARRVLVEDDNIRALIMTLNVPSPDVETFGTGLHNTYGEACAVADWVERNGAHRIVIPTELFPSRRVRWIFSRKLAPLGATAEIDMLQIDNYSADDWWTKRGGRIQFLTEIAKYLYYGTRYLFAQC
jgi:uncharacterized SAM-binding protein YcdF (DUF218 family)